MNPRDVICDIVNRILKFPLGNVRTLRSCSDSCIRNMGYPISMLITASIELVGSLVYANNCPADQFAYYMRKYMRQVNKLYGVRFERFYHDSDGKQRISYLSDLIYGFFRCELAHIANAVDPFPVDAQDQTYAEHLMLRSDGTILIHSYQLYLDFMQSLFFLYKNLQEDPGFNQKVAKNISRFDTRLNDTSTEIRKVINSPALYFKKKKAIQYPRK